MPNRHNPKTPNLPNVTKVITKPGFQVSTSVHQTPLLEYSCLAPTNEEQILLTSSKGGERLIPQCFKRLTCRA